MTKREIVITGGLGFVGRNFVMLLDKKLKNYKFIIYDKSSKNLKKLEYNNKKNKFDIIIANTLNIKSKLAKYKNIVAVFHFGEFSRIVKSFEYTNECFVSNTLGTFKVLSFCKENNIKIIYSASSSKFGNNGKDEHLSPYSWTKSKNIELIKNFNRWYGLKYEIVYFYNVYGSGQSHFGKLAAVIGIFEGQYLLNKPLTVVSPGTQSRDFTHISDIVRGTYLAWKKNLNKEYLLGTGRSISILKIAKLFETKIKMVAPRPGERLTSFRVNNEAYKILGYKPKINIEKYIKDFVKNNKKI